MAIAGRWRSIETQPPIMIRYLAMGKISDYALQRLVPPAEPGAVVKVAATAGVRPASATWLAPAPPRGHWMYQREIEIEICPNAFRELHFHGKRILWTGIEVWTNNAAARDSQLVYAIKPYSINWFGHASFRKPARSRREAELQLEAALSREDGNLAMALRSLSNDPFETGSDGFCARLANPSLVVWDNLVPVNHLVTVNYTIGQHATHAGDRPAWVFGMCHNFDSARAALIQEVQEDPKVNKVLQEIADDNMPALFDELLAPSAEQALAGWPGGADPRAARTVVTVFETLMRCASRKAGKELGKPRRLSGRGR